MDKWQLDNVYEANSIDAIKDLRSESVHLILSDIPYGIGVEDWDVLHENTNSAFLGSSPAQKRAGSVFRKRGKPINGWSESDRNIPREYYDWCLSWANDWLRILKPGGSAIIFAGRRYSHRCITALEDSGFLFKDMIAWLKNRAPFRAQRLSVIYDRRGDFGSSEKWKGWRVGNLRPTFEPILWFIKPYKIGDTLADNVLKNGLGAYNEVAFSMYSPKVENILSCKIGDQDFGLHPTQKPLALMSALIELTTNSGQIVLDPFCGSGSTLLAAKLLHRRFIGFDNNSDYVQVSKKRLADQENYRLF
jgi:site-specific DNA-methyltransferase (adenine-specific)